MNKDLIDKIVAILEKNSISYKFDSYILTGKMMLRSIFIYSDQSKGELKQILGSEMLKYVRIRKTYSWYLGERKRTLMLKFKKALEMEIPEFEKYPVSSFA